MIYGGKSQNGGQREKIMKIGALAGAAVFFAGWAARKWLGKRKLGGNQWKRTFGVKEGIDLRINLVMRDMDVGDYDKKIISLLAQLTDVGTIRKSFFLDRLAILKEDPLQRIIVIEDVKQKQLLATGTLCIEPKFIHMAGFAGHIEDVVVDGPFRGKGLGSKVVRKLVNLAKMYGCYKVILDCKKHNVAFYEKLGFFVKEVQMALYFPETQTADEISLAQYISKVETMGDNLVARQLSKSDLEKGDFVNLLGQLTTVGSIPEAFLKKRLELLRKSNRELMFVIEDTKLEKIVAAGTLLVEYKFIHSAGKCAHIEDVVVDKNCRGRGLGKKIVCKLRDAAKLLGCYKCILDCSKKNVGFYEKCGFKENEVCMALYFDGSHRKKKAVSS